jgi:hypothetical protein
VGLVSDTHGLLRPEAVAALRGVELIVHAGDVGAPAVLERLREIAPVVGIRGNNDRGAWAKRLPATDVVEIAGATLYVLHDVSELDLDPAAAGLTPSCRVTRIVRASSGAAAFSSSTREASGRVASRFPSRSRCCASRGRIST